MTSFNATTPSLPDDTAHIVTASGFSSSPPKSTSSGGGILLGQFHLTGSLTKRAWQVSQTEAPSVEEDDDDDDVETGASLMMTSSSARPTSSMENLEPGSSLLTTTDPTTTTTAELSTDPITTLFSSTSLVRSIFRVPRKGSDRSAAPASESPSTEPPLGTFGVMMVVHHDRLLWTLQPLQVPSSPEAPEAQPDLEPNAPASIPLLNSTQRLLSCLQVQIPTDMGDSYPEGPWRWTCSPPLPTTETTNTDAAAMVTPPPVNEGPAEEPVPGPEPAVDSWAAHLQRVVNMAELIGQALGDLKQLRQRGARGPPKQGRRLSDDQRQQQAWETQRQRRLQQQQQQPSSTSSAPSVPRPTEFSSSTTREVSELTAATSERSDRPISSSSDVDLLSPQEEEEPHPDEPTLTDEPVEQFHDVDPHQKPNPSDLEVAGEEDGQEEVDPEGGGEEVEEEEEEGDDVKEMEDPWILLARMVNSLRMLTPIFLGMMFHPSRCNAKLIVGEGGHPLYKGGQRRRGPRCWLLTNQVFDTVSTAICQRLYQRLQEIFFFWGLPGYQLSWDHAEAWQGVLDRAMQLIAAHANGSTTALLPSAEMMLPQPTLPWVHVHPLDEFDHADRLVLSTFTKELDEKFGLAQSPDLKKHARYTKSIHVLYNHLNKVLTQRIPGARLSIYGSCLSDLSIGKGSDVDLSLHMDEAQQARTSFENGSMPVDQYQKVIKNCVHRVCRMFEVRRGEFRNMEPIWRARVPVVKGTYLRAGNPYSSDGSLDFDICFLNDIAVANSSLLREYTMVDARVKQIMMAVKKWAKRNKICSAKDNALSSYTWMNLVIFYLQCLGMVPNLQCPVHMARVNFAPDPMNRWHVVDNLATAYLRWDQVKADWTPSASTQSLAVSALLYGFFDFYAQRFPAPLLAMSIKRGASGVLPKTFSQRRSLFWCIEDPFETFDSHRPHDLGFHASDDVMVEILGCVQATREQMKRALVAAVADPSNRSSTDLWPSFGHEEPAPVAPGNKGRDRQPKSVQRGARASNNTKGPSAPEATNHERSSTRQPPKATVDNRQQASKKSGRNGKGQGRGEKQRNTGPDTSGQQANTDKVKHGSQGSAVPQPGYEAQVNGEVSDEQCIDIKVQVVSAQEGVGAVDANGLSGTSGSSSSNQKRLDKAVMISPDASVQIQPQNSIKIDSTKSTKGSGRKRGNRQGSRKGANEKNGATPSTLQVGSGESEIVSATGSRQEVFGQHAMEGTPAERKLVSQASTDAPPPQLVTNCDASTLSFGQNGREASHEHEEGEEIDPILEISSDDEGIAPHGRRKNGPRGYRRRARRPPKANPSRGEAQPGIQGLDSNA